MSIIIFIIVLAVLIFVHELGHFIAAKGAGIRVDEFGIGYPPRAVSFKPKKSETRYSLNWIPFGGFVKIFGEDPDEESMNGPDSARSLTNKPKLLQVWVLTAGVIFNWLFAFVLISIGFIGGLPTSITPEYEARVDDAHLVITNVLEDSPASLAGVNAGDRVLVLEAETGDGSFLYNNPTVKEFQYIVGLSKDDYVHITYERDGETGELKVLPKTGIVGDAHAIGVGLDFVGTLKLPPHEAVLEGAKLTISLTKAIAIGLGTFVVDAVTGEADFSQVAGPVGIVSLVGDASALGFVYLLSFTAFISINLAIINLVPFPALDGGRILFIAIEAVKRSRINPRVANRLNLIGFAILIALMVAVTVGDIARLIN